MKSFAPEPTQVIQGSFQMSLLADRLDDSQQMAQLPTIPGYELLNQIGAGGMGVVYRARHIELDRIVAIKVLTRESMLDRESHERFHREATAVAKVQHPNIIQVFDVGTYPVRGGSVVRQPYLSLEYVGGGSLVRQMRNPQPLKQVAKLMETIARAVHAAHEQGVIHRDLKPGNVLLTPDGTPKIADFGLAKSMDTFQDNNGEALTQVGVLIGTPEYMSPEHVQGQDNRPCVDIYALGVILYELMTGRVPFKGETPMETLVLLQSQEPLSPKKLKPNLPSDLETICTKCLHKNPLKRYTTALELAEDLARWQRGEAIRARPVSLQERVYRWTMRNPFMAGLIGLVLLGTLSSFVALLIAYGIAEQNTKLARESEEKAEKRLTQQKHELYRASCLAASSGLQLFNATMTKQALDDTPEELRGWEWHYFYSQLDRRESHEEIKVNLASVRRVYGSEYWIFGDWNSELLIYSLKLHKVIRSDSFDPHTTMISRDFGRTQYAIRHGNGPIEIRKIETAELIKTIDVGETVTRQILVSEDDKHLLLETPTDIQLYHLSDGSRQVHAIQADNDASLQCVSRDHSIVLLTFLESKTKATSQSLLHTKSMTLVPLAEPQTSLRHTVLSHDGTRLLTSCLYPYLNPTLWDTATGQIVRKLEGHTNQIETAEFSPDDSMLITGSLDHSARVWDGKTGLQRYTIQAHRSRISSLNVSPDGTRLVLASYDQSLSLWDLKTGEQRARLLGHKGSVVAAAFTKQGDRVLSMAGAGEIASWNITTLESDNGLRGHTNYVYSVDYHPTKPLVISSAWDGTVRIWDIQTCKTISTFSANVGKILSHVRFHPNGRWFMTVGRDVDSTDGYLRLCDVETGEQIRTWKIKCVTWKDGRGCFSPDGATFTVGGLKLQSVQVDDNSGYVKDWLNSHVMTYDVAYSQDGSMLVAAFEDQKHGLRVWDTKTELEHQLRIPELLDQTFFCLAFHPISQNLYAATDTGKIYIVDLKKNQLLGVIENGVSLYDMVFTPDGSRLAIACSNNQIRLWDPKSRKLISELTGHHNYVHALTFSPNGEILVSGSGDKTLRLWKSIPESTNP